MKCHGHVAFIVTLHRKKITCATISPAKLASKQISNAHWDHAISNPWPARCSKIGGGQWHGRNASVINDHHWGSPRFSGGCKNGFTRNALPLKSYNEIRETILLSSIIRRVDAFDTVNTLIRTHAEFGKGDLSHYTMKH